MVESVSAGVFCLRVDLFDPVIKSHKLCSFDYKNLLVVHRLTSISGVLFFWLIFNELFQNTVYIKCQ